MIEIKNLTKNYGSFRALDSLSLSIPKGQILGLLGPNGAGKSTTMKIVSGFMSTSSGSVSIDSFDVFESPLEVKKRVGYLPEIPPLYLDMRVEEFLRYVCELKHLAKNEFSGRLSFVAEHCGLKDKMKQVIGSLSKGYRQRVGIAQAIVHNPEVIIFDEPTVGLDPIQIIEIRKLIKSLALNHTVILSTHILPEVVMTCSRVVMINQGKLVADKSVDEFSSNNDRSLEETYLQIVSQDLAGQKVQEKGAL